MQEADTVQAVYLRAGIHHYKGRLVPDQGATIRSVIKARPYVLRAYFDTQLLLAESSGCMTHAYRQFFMGHTGDMEARYTTNKGRLTEQMIEDMRGAFARSEPFLSAGSADDIKHRRETFL